MSFMMNLHDESYAPPGATPRRLHVYASYRGDPAYPVLKIGYAPLNDNAVFFPDDERTVEFAHELIQAGVTLLKAKGEEAVVVVLESEEDHTPEYCPTCGAHNPEREEHDEDCPNRPAEEEVQA